jgi:hypothetical protein
MIEFIKKILGRNKTETTTTTHTDSIRERCNRIEMYEILPKSVYKITRTTNHESGAYQYWLEVRPSNDQLTHRANWHEADRTTIDIVDGIEQVLLIYPINWCGMVRKLGGYLETDSIRCDGFTFYKYYDSINEVKVAIKNYERYQERIKNGKFEPKILTEDDLK